MRQIEKNRFKAKNVYRGKRKIGLSEKIYSDVRFLGNESKLTSRTFTEYSSSSRY